MKSFWKKYVRYRKELDEKFKMFGGHVAIQFKNVRQCMDEYTFESLCLYRWQRDPDDISDDEVNELFQADCMGSKLDIKAFLDRIERELRMDKSVSDGPSRVLCLVRLYEKICTESGFPKYYEIEVEAARHHFLNALEPVSMVWKDFVNLCIDYMKTWCMYEDVFKSESKSEAKQDPKKKLPSSGSKPQSDKKQGDAGTDSTENKKQASKPTYDCLKCQSTDHNVWKCPKVKDEAEAEALLKVFYDAKRASESKKPNIDSLMSVSGSDFIRAICGGLDMKVLFDSGSDACVISRDFVRRASATGSNLSLKALPRL
ncbi:hypothetical protein AC1031_008226 [Aphanomyces cochlioides]|nr:hypothetical protein AC1031_008226 [Aphanomyces cochlioides]